MSNEIQVTINLTEDQHREAIAEWAALRGFTVRSITFHVEEDDRTGRRVVRPEVQATSGSSRPQTREEKHAAWVAAGNRGIDPDYPEDRSDQ